jgi:sugar lactone lactonase YvrE
MGGGTVECVVEIRSELGESPMWHGRERLLYWIDITRPAIHRFDPRTRRNEQVKADLGSYLGGLVFRANGGWVGVKEDGIWAIDPATGSRSLLSHPEAGIKNNALNDAKCDHRGRLWTGSLDRGEKDPTGHLYVIGKDLRARRIDSNIICSNGPAFSPDGRLAYFADSVKREIYRYAIDPASGEVGPRQLFARVSDASLPDGMTVDADGFLWNAHWDGGRVTRYSPDGKIDRIVRLPVSRITAVGFGGDDLKTLYITTAAGGLTDAQLREHPLSGSLFALDPGVRGVPEPDFLG